MSDVTERALEAIEAIALDEECVCNAVQAVARAAICLQMADVLDAGPVPREAVRVGARELLRAAIALLASYAPGAPGAPDDEADFLASSAACSAEHEDCEACQ